MPRLLHLTNLPRLLACIAMISTMAVGHAAPPAPIKICFEDIPQKPWTFPDGTGLNIDLLKMTEAKLDERFVFISKPWKRCLEEARVGAMDAVVGAADIPERRVYGMFPTLPDGQTDTNARLFKDDYLVFVHAGSNITWDGKRFTNLSTPIAIQSGYMVKVKLGKLGVAMNESSKSTLDALRLLEAGIVDAAVTQGTGSLEILRQNERFRSAIAPLPVPFDSVPFYLLISKVTYQRDPQRIQRIWRAIPEVRETPAYQQREAAALSSLHTFEAGQ
ncbi:hypothetical protein [Chitinivorax sp. B]|uniref:substrate-binding periplasmic protein n=1 Tax=Chitinivorax sp. B TaxID=2502235 RepID=UPI0010F8165B|nr:hypothetical protein [Chitinivorax sp. B]